MGSRVKNADRQARATVSRADWPRDPVTHRWLPKSALPDSTKTTPTAPATAPGASPTTPLPPAGPAATNPGGDPAGSDPFRGRARRRLRPSSR
jgi:hypothetical protein